MPAYEIRVQDAHSSNESAVLIERAGSAVARIFMEDYDATVHVTVRDEEGRTLYAYDNSDHIESEG